MRWFVNSTVRCMMSDHYVSVEMSENKQNEYTFYSTDRSKGIGAYISRVIIRISVNSRKKNALLPINGNHGYKQ